MGILDEVQKRREAEQKKAAPPVLPTAQQVAEDLRRTGVLSDLEALKKSLNDPNATLKVDTWGVTLSWDQVDVDHPYDGKHHLGPPQTVKKIGEQVVSVSERTSPNGVSGRFEAVVTETVKAVTYETTKPVQNARAVFVSVREISSLTKEELAKRFVEEESRDVSKRTAFQFKGPGREVTVRTETVKERSESQTLTAKGRKQLDQYYEREAEKQRKQEEERFRKYGPHTPSGWPQSNA